MKKIILTLAVILTLSALYSCNNSEIGIIGGADGPTSVITGDNVSFENMSYTDIAVALAQSAAKTAADKDFVETYAMRGEMYDIFSTIGQGDYSKPDAVKLITPDRQKTLEALAQSDSEDEFAVLYKSGKFPLTSFAVSHNAYYGVNTLAVTSALTATTGLAKRTDFSGEFAVILTYGGDYSVFVAFEQLGEAVQAKATFIRNGERAFTDFLDSAGLVYTIGQAE